MDFWNHRVVWFSVRFSPCKCISNCCFHREKMYLEKKKCTFSYGSGSGSGSGSLDLYIWLTDPALFISDLQDANNFYSKFFASYFLKVHLYHSSQIKRHRSKKTEFQGFLPIFALWWEDPGPDLYLWRTDPDLGDPKSYVSGSGTLVIRERKMLFSKVTKEKIKQSQAPTHFNLLL